MAAVAPMDLVIKSEPASIPLECTICPKKPAFSDVSHLLTHISSKSHLSYQFKVELRSDSEREAREAIQLYKEWYERYGIKALLADRMAAKESKKTGKRVRSSNAGSQPQAPGRPNDRIKTEPGDFSESAQVMGHWGNAHPSHHLQNARRDYFEGQEYQTPTMRRSRSDYSVPGTPIHRLPPRYERWETETTTSALASESTEFAEDGESSKLKGVRYPGMGLFDSANETQKRMRNQRKDESVLRLMEQTSCGIEPTECIWTEDGELQRRRDIYATPSVVGSPERVVDGGDTRKKKKNRRSTGGIRPARQTRSSARIAQNKTISKNQGAELKGSPLARDDNSHSHSSSHSHGATDSYDVFCDPPKNGPAQESPLNEPGSVISVISQPLTPGDSVLMMPFSFGLRNRQALQSMNSNIGMGSPLSKPPKNTSHQYFPTRDSGSASFPSHTSTLAHPFFHSQHAGNFNPLYTQSRPGFFHPYHAYPNYGLEPKPVTQGFQPINNAMNHNLGSMSFNSFSTSYTSDSPHDRVHHPEFDI
ncbi:hypothetical protein B0H66DRAFT_610810 [Apodospora peruviana]|uniref:Uncharacterized protein n=1 Tax=Apodospora peruviana TaxID=516989 RepID=A0AAE0IR36_9PEZI|nr:hypothetical protein B0H66DRAFT_610810 [Apodospora peruviana]